MNISYFNKNILLKTEGNLLKPNILLKYDSYLQLNLLTASLIVKLCRSRNNNNTNWNICEYIFTDVIPCMILDSMSFYETSLYVRKYLMKHTLPNLTCRK